MKLDQRGQGLVETALALPVLMFLLLGVLQVASLLWLRVRLQHAAHCAARAYTVWVVEDKAVALKKAQAAGWLALRPQPRGLRLQVAFVRTSKAPAKFLDARTKPETHTLKLTALQPAMPGFSLLRQRFELQAEASILSETPFARELTLPSL